ncbi:phage protein [Vibrio phage pTD1]|uniref:Phage protein n=1 Tax=Vibrio phage pTD1 TaxID=1938577 RepID=A0A1Q2U2W3_9CAUD|nr:internal head protein [Vibrio phage pTD1]BAW98299.1 phage protein [Vibrio phage pTD1]
MSLSIKAILAAQAGCENLVPTPPVELTPLEQHELAEEVAHAELANEIQENSKEIQKLGDAVEAIDEEVEELEQVVDGMEFLCAQPELNRGAIDILYRRATKLSHNLGGEEVRQVAGNESLVTDDAYRAEVISGCEGFMDGAKKALQSAGEFIKRLFFRLVDNVVAFFKLSSDLTAKAEKLKAEHKDHNVKPKIKLGAWNRWIDKNMTSTDGLFSDLAKAQHKFCEIIKNSINVTEINDSHLVKLQGEIADLSRTFKTAVRSNSTNLIIFNLGGGRDYKNSRNTNSDNLIEWTYPDENNSKPETLDKTVAEFSFNLTNGNQEEFQTVASIGGEVDAFFTHDKLDQILDSVVKNAELIKSIKKDAESAKSNVSGIVHRLTKLEAGKGDEKATKVYVATLKALSSKYTQLSNNLCRLMTEIDKAKLAAVKAHY